MAPTKEFEGDEFSNNLFSDLAPLLTLFGEQVTKQFLSMSMGWADNILLAMGPLGTITIMVSAIRVGGGKRMKALSTGESINSRTRASLVNFRECLMKAMLIAHDGEVFDLKKAFNKRYIETDVGVMEAYLDETLKWELETIYNAAPNLALNVGSGTASSQELHAWASLGILLQLFGIAFPGITTYYWKWDKAGSPIAGYAYICFCTGTTFLITGILLCGHVIEGVTKERTFSLTEMGAQEGLKFFSLQHRQTVGDQQFPSCVIIHSKDDNKLRTSRLSSMSYRNLVTVSTIITLAGYVVQFVGLRALHWSATIIQLSITVILAAIRAWVRRSLASDPMNSSAVPGYELAWLTLYVVSDRRKTTGTSKSAIERGNPQKYGYSRIREMFRQHLRGDMNIQQLNIDNTGFLWEIISGQRQDANLTDNVTYNQLTSPLRGPLKVSLEVQPKNHAPHAYHTGADKLNPLQTYLLINSSTAIRIEGDSSDAAQRSKALCAVIENNESFERPSMEESENFGGSYLGMFLSSTAADINAKNASAERVRDIVIEGRPGSSKTLQYAQELFSLFILALASAIEKINGDGMESRRNIGGINPVREHPVFRLIADEAVKAGLAQDTQEAYTLIIPAFANYDLLPTESRNSVQEYSSVVRFL
nr:ankyrin repeat protein [Colletotrichum truncatum]KAF6790901.1 ankyrin repeat protein [Colletotrichum truncatum]